MQGLKAELMGGFWWKGISIQMSSALITTAPTTHLCSACYKKLFCSLLLLWGGDWLQCKGAFLDQRIFRYFMKDVTKAFPSNMSQDIFVTFYSGISNVLCNVTASHLFWAICGRCQHVPQTSRLLCSTITKLPPPRFSICKTVRFPSKHVLLKLLTTYCKVSCV